LLPIDISADFILLLVNWMEGWMNGWLEVFFRPSILPTIQLLLMIVDIVPYIDIRMQLGL